MWSDMNRWQPTKNMHQLFYFAAVGPSNLQPLRAALGVTFAVAADAADLAIPLLQGQTQASADASGAINMSDLVLTAAPSLYNLSVSLPDWPQVGLAAALALLCVMECVRHKQAESPAYR